MNAQQAIAILAGKANGNRDAAIQELSVAVADLLVAEVVSIPLAPDPALQERARKASAGRKGDE